MINLLPELISKHIVPLSKASEDDYNNVVFIDDEFEVVDFDKVKEEYCRTKLKKSGKRIRSNDALYYNQNLPCKLFMVEFKNGYIGEKLPQHKNDVKDNNWEIIEKIFNSVNILIDIMKEKGGIELMQTNPFKYLRENACYILVYNSKKNDPLDELQMTERTREGLHDQQEEVSESSRKMMKKHMSKNAKTELIAFGLDFFQGYLFKTVHTYTEDEFKKKTLTYWKKAKEKASANPAT